MFVWELCSRLSRDEGDDADDDNDDRLGFGRGKWKSWMPSVKRVDVSDGVVSGEAQTGQWPYNQ